jgi:hypothetical protein
MKKILINYADKIYLQSQRLNSKSGIQTGGFTEVKEYGLNNLDANFVRKNEFILQYPRGAGYWVWKPYIIYHTLRTLQKDDILFYSDAGAEFISSLDEYMFDLCHQDPVGVILFKNNPQNLNKIWTKRDCFYYMNADQEEYINSPQLTATFQLCRKTEESLEFYRQYLDYSQDPRIITDAQNTCGLPNYPEFQDHRHDQSILSLLQLKHKLTTYEDPSQFGNDFRENGFKQLINHHRIKT